MVTSNCLLKNEIWLPNMTTLTFLQRRLSKRISKGSNKLFIPLLFMILSQYSSLGQSKMEISSNFPGGNIKVDKIDKDTVWMSPDLRDTEGYWFYWYFKITGMAGKTVHFQFPQKPVFGRYGPAYSINNDSTWKWYGETSYANHGFTFSFSKGDTSAYFSIAFPYTQKNLYDFLGKLRNRGSLKLDTLCFSRENRAVEQIHIMPAQKTLYKVLITARNHACEMTTDYVLEGIIRSILNERDLQFLRDHVEFCIVPFVDKDGVENGDQGKWRKPHDYNRDYDNNSIYPIVKAIKAKVPEWSDGKLKIVLDLHCPYLRGDGDAEYICFIGNKNKAIQQQQLIMSDLVAKNCNDELRFYGKNFMKYGTLWNTDKNYTQGASCSQWGTTIPGIALSTTLEFPYANASGIAVSKDNARMFGGSMAYSIQDYLPSLAK